MGALPEAGEWVKLEVPAEKLGPQARHEGHRLCLHPVRRHGLLGSHGMSSRVDPAKDPQWSWNVWVGEEPGQARRRPAQRPADARARQESRRVARQADAKRLQDWWLENEYQGAREPRGRRARARSSRWSRRRKTLEAVIPATFVMADLPRAARGFVMMRGQYDKPGDKVDARHAGRLARRCPKQRSLHAARSRATGSSSPRASAHRARDGEPLLAAVLRHGPGEDQRRLRLAGRAAEPSRSCSTGSPSTFRESGWDVKALVQHASSPARTYRQTVAGHAGTARSAIRRTACSPAARASASMPRRCATTRSSSAACSMPTIGGKGVKPYQPPNIWEPVGFGGSNTRNYMQDHGDALYRRSLYTFLKRTAPPPFMTTFDAPNREQFCTRRERSNTPLQALQLMNDVQHFEAARSLRRSASCWKADANPAERITCAFRIAYSRASPTAERDSRSCRRPRQQHLSALSQPTPQAAKEAITNGESKRDAKLAARRTRRWTLVANLLLNLDEDRDEELTAHESLSSNIITHQTRRQFFGGAGLRLGGLALASLVGRSAHLGAASSTAQVHPPLPGLPHFAPKAKRLIYLHMNGGPSQLDLCDYKPKLAEHFDKDLPDSIRNGQRITTMTSGQARLPGRADRCSSSRSTARAARGSANCCRTRAKIVDDIALIKTRAHRTPSITIRPAPS